MPKACVHRAETPLRSFEHYARDVLDIREDDVVLPVPKLFFGYARDLAALYPFGVGAAGIVFPERSTPERIFELVARHRPTILVNVPTMIRAMLEQPDQRPVVPAAVHVGRRGAARGAAPPLAGRFGVEVLDGIGSSEAYHIYISNRPGAARPGTLGQVVPGYARARGRRGRARAARRRDRPRCGSRATRPRSCTGTRARSRCETYAGDVVMSGDLFARDADGFFHYRGRADDLLKVGGIWVAPQEIEQCLAAHADVAECAVVGYEEDGLQKPRAFVVLRDGATLRRRGAAGAREGDAVAAQVPARRALRRRAARTGSGKIDRRALREVLA